MKRLFKLFLSLATVAVVAASCTKADEDLGKTSVGTGDVQLTVGFPDTRIAVTPVDKGGAVTVWEANDKIALYDKTSGALQASFILVSGENTKQATFSMEQGGTFDPAKVNSYTVVYPYNGEQTLEARYKKLDDQVQDGNGTATYIKPFMSGNISVSNGKNVVNLVYEVALFTAIVEQPLGIGDNQVTKFTLYDDMGRTYNVALNNVTAWSDGKPLTVHVMILPRSNGSASNYRISLYTKTKIGGFVGVYSGEKAYKQQVEGGFHYYKNIDSDELKYIVGVSLSAVSAASIVDNQICVIDATTLSTDLTPLVDVVKAASAPITVVLPFAEGINNNTFKDCTKLKYIDLPEATVIGLNTFEGCTGLTGINAPKVDDINQYAFKGCTALRSVAFPGMNRSDKVLGVSVFEGCTSLVSAEFPNLPTDIYANAFNGCKVLTTVHFPFLKTIGVGAFLGCDALVSVNFPEVTTVKQKAFQNLKNLYSVVMPKVINVGENSTQQAVFSGCTKLAEVYMPEAVLISEEAFKDCAALPEVSFPKATSLNAAAFSGCTQLKKINLPLATDVSERVFLNCSSLEVIDLPEVDEIQIKQTFEGCTALKQVSAPKLSRFRGNDSDGIGFKGCTSLTSMELGTKMVAAITGVPIIEVLKDNNFENCRLWLNSAEQPNVRENPWTWFFVKFREITFADMPR